MLGWTLQFEVARNYPVFRIEFADRVIPGVGNEEIALLWLGDYIFRDRTRGDDRSNLTVFQVDQRNSIESRMRHRGEAFIRRNPDMVYYAGNFDATQDFMTVRVDQGDQARSGRAGIFSASMVSYVILLRNFGRLGHHADFGFRKTTGNQDAAVCCACQFVNVVETLDAANSLKGFIQMKYCSEFSFRNLHIGYCSAASEYCCTDCQ